MKKSLIRVVFVHLLLLWLVGWQCAGSGFSPPVTKLSQVESRNIPIDSTLAGDPALNDLIEPYRRDMDEKMTVVIGQAAADLSKGKPEAPLNNFVADLMRERASAEFGQPVQVALTNLGGLRVDIPAGPITVGKIYEVMPFENELVVLEMSGGQLITLAGEIGEVGGEAISGMTLEFKDTALAKITVDQRPVHSDSLYYLVTTDYLSSPDRNRFRVLGMAPRTVLGVTLRDAILDKIQQLTRDGLPVSAAVDNRIIFRRNDPVSK